MYDKSKYPVFELCYNRAKQLALENFLAQQIPTSVTITKSEPEPKKEEQIELEKPKKRVIDFD